MKAEREHKEKLLKEQTQLADQLEAEKKSLSNLKNSHEEEKSTLQKELERKMADINSTVKELN